MATVILNTSEDGTARAYIIPEGELKTEVEHDVFQDDFSPWKNYGLPSYRLPVVVDQKRLVIDDLGEYTLLQSAGDGMQDDTSITVKAAMKLVTDRLDTIRHEALQGRRRKAAEEELVREGVGPKKARRLAEAALSAADRVK